MGKQYKAVKSVPGLECTTDARFRYNGKPKKPIYATTVTGRRATVRLTIQIKGKTFYWQAAKLVAETWKAGYTKDSYIIYADGNCHNITADNLRICDRERYYRYMRRNSGFHAASLQERKRKLQLVIDEATMTLNYFNTLDMTDINQHVKDYLYTCLMEFSMKTLQFGEKKSKSAVTEVIGEMYEKIMGGMCLYNYERFCKRLLHDIKTTGKMGEYWFALCKPIQIEVEQLNLDCLWERYKVTRQKQ